MKRFKVFQEDYKNSLPPGVRLDMERGGKTQSPLGDLGIMSAAAGLAKTGIGGAITRALMSYGRKRSLDPKKSVRSKLYTLETPEPKS